MSSIKILLAASFLLGLSARAYTPEETRRSFEGCKTFLAMSKAEQRIAAERAGRTVAEGKRLCRYMLRRGLDQILRDEAEYQRGGSSPRHAPNRDGRPECTRRLDCPSSAFHCVSGSCQSVGSAGRACTNGGFDSCMGTERCLDGICQ